MENQKTGLKHNAILKKSKNVFPDHPPLSPLIRLAGFFQIISAFIFTVNGEFLKGLTKCIFLMKKNNKNLKCIGESQNIFVQLIHAIFVTLITKKCSISNSSIFSRGQKFFQIHVCPTNWCLWLWIKFVWKFLSDRF